MTQTPTVHLTQPVEGGSDGVWGGDWNTNATLLDRALNAGVTKTIPDANTSLVSDGTLSDQSIYRIIRFAGALTADRTVTLPTNARVVTFVNSTTGGKGVVLDAGGTKMTLAPDGQNVETIIDSSGNITSPTRTSGSYSLGTTGYVNLPGGLLLQWGDATITTGGPEVVTFPVAFTTLYGAVATFAGQTAAADVVGPQIGAASSATDLELWAGVGDTIDVFWAAWGKA